MNRNHPIIIRFPGPNHPISARPRLIARPESTDNRPIFPRQSSDAAAKIVRYRQAKRPNRQSPTICSAANPVEFDGIRSRFRNASQVFEKGDPKNFIPEAGIQRIADTLIGWTEAEKLSRIVDHAEPKRNDYNISPSRYIHTSDAETYRLIAEIVGELKAIEAEAKETDRALAKILKQLGVGA